MPLLRQTVRESLKIGLLPNDRTRQASQDPIESCNSLLLRRLVNVLQPHNSHTPRGEGEEQQIETCILNMVVQGCSSRTKLRVQTAHNHYLQLDSWNLPLWL